MEQYKKGNTETVDSLLLESKLANAWKKNTDEAISIIESALDLFDNNDILLYAAQLAVDSGQQIKNKTAAELLDPVIEADPTNKDALVILLEDYFLRGEWELAYNLSSDIKMNADLEDSFILKHVQICLELGFLIEAREFLVPLYNRSPFDEDLQQAYLQLLIAEKNFSEARKLIDTMLPKATSSAKSMLYFERSKMQSDTKLKLADLRSSLTSNPRNESTLYELYSYYFAREDYSKAQYYIKQVMVLKPNSIEIQEKYQELLLLIK